LVALLLWQGFRHELHSDPEREQVFALMVVWLDRLVAAAGADRLN